MHHLYDQSQVNQNNPLRCNSHLLCLIQGNLPFPVVYAFIRTAILIFILSEVRLFNEKSNCKR